MQKEKLVRKFVEYLSLYFVDSQNFQRMNQLSWELAIWLPADLYINLGKALRKVEGKNIPDVVVDVRRWLYEDPGDLCGDNVIIHAKDIGKQEK